LICQEIYNQYIFKGGVYCLGFPMGTTFIQEPYIVHFPNEGIVEKVILTTYCQVNNLDFPIEVGFNINENKVSLTNNDNYSFVRHGSLENNNLSGTVGFHILQKDITDFVNSTSDSLTIFIEENLIPPEDSPNQYFTGFTLTIIYSLSNGTNFTLQQYINSGYDGLSKSTLLTIENQKNPNDDAFLGILSDRIGQTLSDGYNFYLNSGQIGTINMVNEPFNVAGVMGSFHFSDDMGVGLYGNNSNFPINGNNGFMKLPNITNVFEAKVEYISGTLNMPNNILLGYNLVYSTPCEPFEVFVPRDTTLCQGASFSLQASGGQRYKWLPETGLSCYDCANPTFTADTTTFYSLQIFNSDSCSVIRTVRLFVEEPKSVSVQSTNASFCGGATGSVIMQSNAFYNRYSLDGVLFPVGFTLSNLNSGLHEIVGVSETGCSSFPITVAVDSINSTDADFWRTPLEGSSPLNVSIENKSQQATNFLWQVDTLFFQNIPNPYTFTEPGWHTITLYAWKYDTLCADTVSKTVFVRIPQIIPTAFTPNNDGDNDVWELPYIDVLYPENQVFVYNRWGNLLYSSKKGAYATNPWDGTFEGKPLPVGSYFYVLETNNPDFPKMNGQVSVIRK
jgi:gliding motility-associated-like protein